VRLLSGPGFLGRQAALPRVRKRGDEV